jgi:branched-chain amino acid transport system ATP-binding protein
VPLLEVQNVMVFYENALALNNLSLRVEPGEIVGVIGPNSAGKTTLMNTISGLIVERAIQERRRGGERITVYGSVRFEGEDLTSVKPPGRVKRGIVLCRERHPVFPESDVLENLRIAGYLRSGAQTREAAARVFELFPALTALRRRKAGFLSGGEQQMLAIGMTLVAGPRLLLLDEPLLGLSPHIQTVLVAAIRALRLELKLTIVVAEQFARPILPLIDRGYVIENGNMTLHDTGPALLANPEVRAAYFGI